MTKIEWTDISKNPVKGYCPMNCSYCYAHDFYNRFKWDRTIRFEPKVLDEIKQIKKPSKIFVGSTIDLFHPKTFKQEWFNKILETIEECPQHVFQMLTKLPQNIPPIEYPKNLWLGISIDGIKKYNAYDLLYFISDEHIKAFVKFVSLEPYKKEIDGSIITGFDWVIVGGQTGKQKFIPPKEWIERIISWCKTNRDIPIFLKDNCFYPEVKQEYPKLKTSGLVKKK